MFTSTVSKYSKNIVKETAHVSGLNLFQIFLSFSVVLFCHMITVSPTHKGKGMRTVILCNE